MLKRFLVFFSLLSVVFPVFSATQQPADSGSSQKGKPSVKFKEWQIGRSDKNTDSNNDNPTSFITSTQEECHFTASVGYDGNQGDNVSPIDPSTVSWTVPVADPKTMKLDASSVKTNWDGKHPSKLDTSTSFNVVGTLNLPKVVGTRIVTYDDGTTKRVPAYLSATACSHIDDADRLKRVPRHRGNTKLGFTLKFTAKTEDGQEVFTELVLKADEIDQLRQEYVDYNRPIPRRRDGRLQSQDHYDFGHYQIMLNIGLASKQRKWVEKINERRGTDKETGEKIPAFALRDFLLTSGYRNPHHNFDHARSTALHSPHMYGSALDVRGTTDAHGKTLDINGDKKNTAADRTVMYNAALAAGSRPPIIYSKTKHVHADWEQFSDKSEAAKPYKLPPDGTDARAVVKKDEKAVKLLACGHAEGSSGYHTEIPMECGEKFWYCHGDIDNVLDSHQRIACPLNASGEKCNVLGGHFYACAPHTHRYPDGTSISSPGSKFTGECGEHQVTASEASLHKAVGYACGSHSYYPCLGEPSSAETSQHLTQTLPCGSHVGRPCLAAASHLSPVSCPQQDGKACSYGSYYTCSQHTHAYPKTPVVNPVPLKPDPPKPDPKPTVQPKPDPPANTKITGDCGVHQIASSEASSHEAVKHPCGSHSYYPCQGAPSASEKNRHITQTLPCGSHVGRACLAAASHLSSVSCPQQDGKACSYGSYYTCSQHTHAYPTTVVNPPPKPKPDPVPKAPPKQPDPDPQVTSPCGHTHAQSESSSHTASSYPCGSHTYYPCLGSPSFAEQKRHKYQELACCVHYGYPCSASTSHTRQVTCPKKNGKACTYGYGYYYGCSPHTHKYPPSLVACGGASYTGCLGASARTAHHVALCRSGCGNGYWTCSATAVENHETVFTCRRSGCGQTFTRCTNTPTSCVREGKPSNYHWAR